VGIFGWDAWRRQRDSSLSVALQMLADNKVDAVVSAGNTGAVVSGGTFIVRFLLPGDAAGLDAFNAQIVIVKRQNAEQQNPASETSAARAGPPRA